MPAIILEKDVWVCWALETLFSMPGHHPMAFKGGTSLSKVFSAISRFSEDVDVTIDYKHLDPTVNPFDPSLSRNRVKAIGEDLASRAIAYLADVVGPYLEKVLGEQLTGEVGYVRVVGDCIYVDYPTALPASSGYVERTVKLEFGGKNSITPNESFSVTAYVANETQNLIFPSATVEVLSAKRTFWEKATLIHAECNRDVLVTKDRWSRHWYDLDQLSEHEIGRSALKDGELLADVIKFKNLFYYSKKYDYEACNTGGLKLIPSDENLKSLEEDYERMLDGNMIYGSIPKFSDIIVRLGKLEIAINQRFAS
jgi:hypothetical protein